MKTKIIAIVLASQSHGAELKSIELSGSRILVKAEFGKDHKKYELLHTTNLVKQTWSKCAQMDWKHPAVYLPSDKYAEFFKLVPVCDDDEQ